MKNKKFFLAILVILAVFAALYYFLVFKNQSRQEPAVFSGWQTYKALGAEGFSIQYPPELTAQAAQGSIVAFVGKNSPANYYYNIEIGRVSTSTENFQDKITADTVYDASGMHPKFSDFTKIKLGNNEFYAIKAGLFEGQLSMKYYIAVQSGIYSFSEISYGVDLDKPEFQSRQRSRKYDSETNAGDFLVAIISVIMQS